ncbi:MAG: hypothetical protein A2V52_01105 [Actinobacteria bacterium RBG_19FT_COMBO_54_7]|uniref:Lysozyme n=1 Tax=Candidatus Solincola sediminis TaxID=1797199 RepID=A0A1F2WIY6_9ACTN|nr:MAG: hypothetical protein A2W01_10080 [Candidatus Solincola sediminis]OFW56796.1 MAG: hypothetical protein A2Y75_06390 [Candidatus Solincola sediminis]OFW70846.1 MAG: hypothetical protein A2V52_01105 [Actinobacteria bacterium RBG_19FT_COMBO_54_7]
MRLKLIERISVSLVVVLLLTAGLLGVLLYYGYIWVNNPSNERFPIRGIDVSEHQGEIDWQAVRSESFDFAFIKATEGKDHADAYFHANWRESEAAGLIRGAYHFFTFKSPGMEQAENFISTVPAEAGCLPPVVDIEFGGNSKEVPDSEQLVKEIGDFIREIEKHYQILPIIYVNHDSYEAYIGNRFEDCPIWISDFFHTAKLKDGRPWTFWQYNGRGRVDGIKGFVDLNVFAGNENQLRQLVSP